MVSEIRADELALTSAYEMDGRLSPAEAHGIVRQRLERLRTPWGLDLVDAHRLAQRLHSQTYEPGEIIVPRGVHADCMGLIVRGRVAVHTGQRGASRTEVVLLPGSTFGEAMLVRGRPSGTTLQALTRCEIRFLQRADLQVLSDKRRAERRAATRRRLKSWATWAGVVCLIVILTLSLPVTRQAVALAPMGLGQWCIQRDYDHCAERAWGAAATLAPDDPNPLLALGTLYFERGEIAAAERAFEAASALAPSLAEVYNNMGLIYARQGEHERAIAAFRKALDLEPGSAIIEHNLGVSLQATHAYDEALDHYQSALALGEPQTATLVNMAIAYYETGQGDKAVDMAREALLRDEGVAPAYAVLGAVALESRRPEEALLSLHRAVALDPSYGQAYFYLGLAHKSLGQPAEAIAAFEQALAAAGDEEIRVRIRRHLNELYQVE